MKRKRLLILGAGVITLIIIGGVMGLAISNSSLFNEDEEDVRELELVLENDKIMTGERFNISISNVPDDANVTWFMRDGEVLFGKSCCHRYSLSDTYEISANARWDGGRGNGNISICSLLEDIHLEREGNRVRDLRIRTGTGNGVYTEFRYCGVENGPEIQVKATLTDAVGNIEIWIFCYAYDTDYGFSEKYQYTAVYETINFDEIFSDLGIPETDEEIYFEMVFVVWEGRIGSYSLTLDVDYPGN